MPEWTLVVLGVLAIPLAAIIGAIAVAGFGIWVHHKSKMRRLQIEDMEAQAEADRAMLGMSGSEVNAHIQTILDRLVTIETRLGQLESMEAVEAAKARGRTTLGGASEGQRNRERGGDRELA